MKLATADINNEAVLILIDQDQDQYWPVSSILGTERELTMQYVIENFANLRAKLKKPTENGAALSSVKLLSPIPRPIRNIWCVGRNYYAHGKELSSSIFKENAKKMNEWPIVFTKVPECVIGTGASVELPVGISKEIDYESELAVVIGKQGKNIQKGDAYDYVFGYTIINDVTARDVQKRHQQWDMGKSFDTFCPMGPCIVTADELNGKDIRVRGWVNDELRQDAKTNDMIFDIPTLIETISRGITIYPGDIIATGTPAGVGMAMNPPKFLQSGDKLRIEIDGIGVLENTVR